MYQVKYLNPISPKGTALWTENYEKTEEVAEAQAIMVRSASMHDMELPENLLAVARAGAGVNNIPLDKCAEQGVVVFNTPGANARSVMELALCGMLLGCRDIVGGINWVQSIKDEGDVAKKVEKGKSKFAGHEIAGKSLGVIGLGAIGGLVANAAISLGMKVLGYDPYASVDAAWLLDPAVEKVDDLDRIFKESDYITVHVPSLPSTKGILGGANIAKMRDGVRLLNLARADLGVDADILAGIESGKIAAYYTDFPTGALAGQKGVVATPHLGASTPEAEDNCAIMAANQLVKFLSTGNIKNSVNFPAIDLPAHAGRNVLVLHANIPATIAKIAGAVAEKGVNIEHLTNKSRGNNACSLLALAAGTSDEDIEWIKQTISEFEGMWRVIVI